MIALQFALLGLATGGVYALLGSGLVVVYRGSGLLNFAHGALAMFGAYAFYELRVRHHLNGMLALVVAIILCAAMGAAIHWLILRNMRQASPLNRMVATLGVVLILQSAAYVRYGNEPLPVPSLLPTHIVHVWSNHLTVSSDRLYILAICVATGSVLYSIYRWTAFGRVTTAVAENQLAAATFGYSPDVIAAVNWAIGGALAGLAGILIAPIIFLEPVSLVLLVVPAMAVALVGGFSSYPVTFTAALVLGVAQSEISRYVSQPGWPTAAPFLVVIAFLVVRGRGLPLRSLVMDRLPEVGRGRVRPVVLLVLWLLGLALALTAGADWDTAMITTFGSAIVCLSVVLLTGYAGQLSLAQYVIAGIGAFTAAKFVAHMPFIAALVLGAVVTAVIGGLLGLPALRVRGATLAVTTLGLGSAVVAVVFNNASWTGGIAGITLPPLSLFGWSINPVTQPDRYAVFCFTLMIAIAIAVANVRRGVTGRRLLAVRANERAAASLGVSVAGVKLYAFVLSAAIAALGGTVLAFAQPSVQMSTFDVFTCILIVGVTVTGGVGYVPGGILGSLLIVGGVTSKLLGSWSSFNTYLPLIGGVLLVFTLVTGPNGSFDVMLRALSGAIARIDALTRRHRTPAALETAPADVTITPVALTIDDVSVAFGGVEALRHVSFDVRPGEVHGLIGPNGAGKTTLIDVVTGFTRAASGGVRLGGTDIGGWTARRRATHGLSRSFQSLELFDELTVEENLAVPSEHRGWRCYITDLVWPGRSQLSATAQAAVRTFDLEPLLGVRPSSLSYGQRKVVAIARAVAGGPSQLLLDEPAAGLADAEAEELAVLIRRLADEWGIGILLVEHRVDLIMSICDRITVLDSGRILATETPAKVRDIPEVIDAYLGAAS